MVGEDNQLYRYDSGAGTWQLFKPDWEFAQVAVAPNGIPWAISSVDQGFYHSTDGNVGGNWAIAGNAGWQGLDIAVGPDGVVFMVGLDNQIYRYDSGGNSWQLFKPDWEFAKIAVAPGGKPWAISSVDGGFYYSTDGNVGGSWEIKGNAGWQGLDIAVGQNGAVFMLGLDKHLYRYDSGSNSWQLFKPDWEFTRIAVAPSGAPWAVSANGGVYYSTDGQVNGNWQMVDYLPDPEQRLPFGYLPCAAENETCTFTGPKLVYYGADPSWSIQEHTNGVACNNTTFGNPVVGTLKKCYIEVPLNMDQIPYGATCDCNYSSGGCKIVQAAPPNLACRCDYMTLLLTCHGSVTTCVDYESPFCRNPDISRNSCLQGGGHSDCDGYE